MRYALLLICVFAIPFISFSQTKSSMNAEEIAAIQTEKMVELLGLNDQQKVEILTINIEIAREMLSRQGGHSVALSAEEKLEMVNRQRLLIDRVLTSEQQVRYAEAHERYVSRIRERAEDSRK